MLTVDVHNRAVVVRLTSMQDKLGAALNGVSRDDRVDFAKLADLDDLRKRLVQPWSILNSWSLVIDLKGPE